MAGGHLEPVDGSEAAAQRGVGEHDVAVFHALSFEEAARLLHALMRWQQTKFDAGYGAISWPEEFRGAGLPVEYGHAFLDEEQAFRKPQHHETFSVTVRLIAPAVRSFGTADQRAQFVRRFLRSSAPTSCAANCSPSRPPAPTWPASAPVPCATATSG